MSIQQNLKRIRSYLNMTQLEMAKVACMSKSNYGKIERCEIGLNETKAIEICKKLNINHLEASDLENKPYNMLAKKKTSKKKKWKKKLLKKMFKLKNILSSHFEEKKVENNVCKTCNKVNRNDIETV